jgi:hypothetical protein
VAINDEMFVEGIRERPVRDGDRVELIQAFSGGEPLPHEASRPRVKGMSTRNE